MIGQKNLLKKFNSFENIPSSVLLFGKNGSGKKTLIYEISKNINVDIIFIDKLLSDDIKIELYTNQNSAIIAIDINSKLTQKQIINIQNSILKFIEELPANYRLFILSEDESSILDTILNRCYIQYMDEYSIKELKTIALEYEKKVIEEYNDEYFEYFKYPIDIINAPKKEDIVNMESLIDTIFSSIGKANISNTLSISKKINFKDDDDLYDLNIFLNIFNNKLVYKLKYDYDKRYFETFCLFNKLRKDIEKVNINKIYLFEQFLLDIKYILV